MLRRTSTHNIKAPSSAIMLLLGSALLIVYALAIVFDWPQPLPDPMARTSWWGKIQGLRGWSVFPEGWSYKRFDPLPADHWLLFLFIGALIALLIYLVRRFRLYAHKRYSILALAALALLGFCLQLSSLWLKHLNSIQILLHRITNHGFTGYYTVAMQTGDLNTMFGGYDDLLAKPQTGDLCLHCVTHPPGPILCYWLLFRVVELLPAAWRQGASDLLMGTFQLHPPAAFSEYPPPDQPVALLVAMIAGCAILLAAALIVFPLYGLARRLAGPEHAFPLAALGLVMPGLVVMNPELDQVYATFMVTVVYLTLRGLIRAQPRPLWGFGVGLLVALGIYMSFGLWVVGAIVVALALAACWDRLRLDLWGRSQPADVARPHGLRSVAGWSVGLAAGVLLPWLLLLFAGLDLLHIYQISSSAHFGGVNEVRPANVYVLFNLVEYVQSAGVALVAFVLFELVSLWRAAPVVLRRPAFGIVARPLLFPQLAERLNIYAILSVAIPLALDLIKSMSGETARVWLFIMPLAMLAVYVGVGAGRIALSRVYWLFGAQFLVAMLMAGFWFTP